MISGTLVKFAAGSVLSLGKKLFKGPQGVLLAASLAAATVGGGYLGVRLLQAESARNALTEEVDTLQEENDRLQTTIIRKRIELENAQDAIRELEIRSLQRQRAEEAEREVREVIQNAPPELDGEAAPIVRRAAPSLERLRQEFLSGGTDPDQSTSP